MIQYVARLTRTGLLIALISGPVLSPAASQSGTASPARKSVFQPKTEHNFEGLDVNGRYHTAMEAVVTIENEKVLDDLLGARTHFKDRLKKQAEMR